MRTIVLKIDGIERQFPLNRHGLPVLERKTRLVPAAYWCGRNPNSGDPIWQPCIVIGAPQRG